MKMCSVEGCGRFASQKSAHGLCEKHYAARRAEQRKQAGIEEGNLCACGCGGYATKGARYIRGHWAKTKEGGDRLSETKHKGSRTPHGDGYFTVSVNRQNKLEHIAVAEKAIGRPLPPGAIVHHIDGIRDNNHPSNLVICQDAAHHQMLHRRARAIAACGYADWRRCAFCGQWDSPNNLYIPPNGKGTIEHRVCGNEYRKKYSKERRRQERERKNPVQNQQSI